MCCIHGGVRLIARLLLFQFVFPFGGQKQWQVRVNGHKLVKVGPCQSNPGFNWKFTIQPDVQEVHRGTFKFVGNDPKCIEKTLDLNFLFFWGILFATNEIQRILLKMFGKPIVFLYILGPSGGPAEISSGSGTFHYLRLRPRMGSSRVRLGSLVPRWLLLGFP